MARTVRDERGAFYPDRVVDSAEAMHPDVSHGFAHELNRDVV